MLVLGVMIAIPAFLSTPHPHGVVTQSGGSQSGGVRLAVCNSSIALTAQATPTSGLAPLSVAFSSNVTGGCPPYSYEWGFGDGGEAGIANPSHIYRSAGTFHVQVEAHDSAGSDAEAFLTIDVQGGAGAVNVSLSADPPVGVAGQPVTLWANATGGNLSSSFTTSWSFGDSGFGSGSPVVHTYAEAGTYTVSASVRDAAGHGGSGSLQFSVGPGGGAPEANLSLEAAPDHGAAPLNVTVNAFSNGGAAADQLTVCFGDGSPCAAGPIGWSGTVPFSVVHEYGSSGNFTVTGSLVNGTGEVVAGATFAVRVGSASPIVVDGTGTPASGTSPLPVDFVATVSGGTAPYTVQWWFGDGAVGSSIPGEPVRHTYTVAGSFVPTLTVTDSGGHRTTTTLGTVIVGAAESFAGLPASFLGLPTGLLVGLALGAVVVLGFVVASFARRRRQQELRKEGEQLVRELEQER